MVAIGVLTATSAVPSGIRIFPSVPSSVASTSMVALSVSISARMSPDRMRSPTPFTHLARLPFSIVGDNAGISTWIGMAVLTRRASAHHVGPQLRRIGFRLMGGKIGRLVDDLADIRVGLLEFVLAG